MTKSNLMHLKTPTFGLLLVSRAPPPSPARASVHAKFTEAALAAAFATKNQGENEGAAQRETGKGKVTLEEQEERVIAAIRAGLHAGAELKIGEVATSLGDFGKACGGVAQTWLTPPRELRVFLDGRLDAVYARSQTRPSRAARSETKPMVRTSGHHHVSVHAPARASG